MTALLFPREPRRMKQPPKDLLREQLVTAADELIRLREENDELRQSIEHVTAVLCEVLKPK